MVKALLVVVGMGLMGVVGLPMMVVAAVLATLAGGTSPPPPITTGIPTAALADYQVAAATCPGLSWSVLAGIGEVESDHGQSNAPGVHSGANPFGAEGPMQFLPGTFREYAVGANPSPYDMADATLAAARLLCANGGADPSTLRAAIFGYNHSASYVDLVLTWAARYLSG